MITPDPKIVRPFPKSLYRCNRCGQTPLPTSECATCLRALLEDVREAYARLRAPNAIHTRLSIKFDWRDRLRLLFHGEARVVIATKTEHTPGQVFSASTVTVPTFFQPRGGPMALAAGEEASE